MMHEPPMKRNWNLFLDDKAGEAGAEFDPTVVIPHRVDPTRHYHVAKSIRTAKKLCFLFGPPDFISVDTHLAKNEFGERDDVIDLFQYLKVRNCNPIPYQLHERKPHRVQSIESYVKLWAESIV